MNLQFYIEKLYASPEFENFKKEFDDAYLFSGFFVIDLVGNDNKQHLDFYVPEFGKLFSFQLESDMQRVPLENIDKRTPEKLLVNYDFDFESVQKKIETEMKSRGIDKEIQKFLFSLQNLGGKDFLVSTVFISGMGILKVNLKLPELEITDFVQKGFMDFIRK